MLHSEDLYTIAEAKSILIGRVTSRGSVLFSLNLKTDGQFKGGHILCFTQIKEIEKYQSILVWVNYFKLNVYMKQPGISQKLVVSKNYVKCAFHSSSILNFIKKSSAEIGP